MRESPSVHAWIATLALLAGLTALPAPGIATEAATRSAATEQGWRDPARWRQLRLGMSRFDVLRILGEPGKVTRYYAFERWEYPDALGQRVNFDERGRLIGWGAFAR